jgi:hypothetical protein
MTQEHPITPPPELVEQWALYQGFESPEVLWRQIATQAARWGADQEVGACCQWLSLNGYDLIAAKFRAARRLKPPSLKEQALQELDLLKADATTHGLGFDAPAIRRALQSLSD